MDKKNRVYSFRRWRKKASIKLYKLFGCHIRESVRFCPRKPTVHTKKCMNVNISACRQSFALQFAGIANEYGTLSANSFHFDRRLICIFSFVFLNSFSFSISPNPMRIYISNMREKIDFH